MTPTTAAGARTALPMFRIVRASMTGAETAYCAQRADCIDNGTPRWRTLNVLGDGCAQDWLDLAEGRMTREQYEKNNRRRYREGLAKRRAALAKTGGA